MKCINNKNMENYENCTILKFHKGFSENKHTRFTLDHFFL